MAKDTTDRKTGNLLATPGASRQAALKARREAAGYKRSTVWIHQASYDAGVSAAQLGSGTIRDFPHDCIDVNSWVLGYATEITKHEQLLRAAHTRQGAIKKQ